MFIDLARWTPLCFVLGLGGIIFLLLHKVHGRLRLSQAQREAPAARASLSSPAELGAPPREAHRYMVELHELARDAKAEIDSKLSALQILCQLAAAESRRLEELIHRAESLGIASAPELLHAIEALAPADLAPFIAGPAPLKTLPPTLECDDRLPRSEAQRALVHTLHEAGKTPAAIARETFIPLGDVELILSLPAPSRESRPAA